MEPDAGETAWEEFLRRVGGSGKTEEVLSLDDELVLDMRQERELRGRFLDRIWKLVLGQVVLLYLLFATYVAVRLYQAKDVDEWSLRLFLGGTLIQSWGIIRVVASHLFPRGKTRRRARRRT